MKPLPTYHTILARSAVFFASTTPALAHPGHEHQLTPTTHPMHLFVEPQHLAGWFGLICVTIALFKAAQPWRKLDKAKACEQSSH